MTHTLRHKALRIKVKPKNRSTLLKKVVFQKTGEEKEWTIRSSGEAAAYI